MSTVDIRRNFKMATDEGHCRPPYSYTNFMHICLILLNSFGCFANLTVTILLFCLRSRKSESLTLLRTLAIGCLAFTIISFMEEVRVHSAHTHNRFIDGLICLLWSTRFLFWYSHFLICHSLFFFVCNRASEMLQIKHYPITTEKQRLTAYLLLVFIGSFIGASPMLLVVHPFTKDCDCALPLEDFTVLSLLYAHAFLSVAILGFIYPLILVYFCIGLIQGLRNSERGVTADELDELYFMKPRSFPTSATANTTAAARSVATMTNHDHRDSKGSSAGILVKSGNKSLRHVWSASFCIIPLTAAFIACTAFESVQQLLSAAGVLIYRLRSPAQQFSVTLMSLFSTLVPIILFFHIPAMRSLIFVAIESIQRKIGRIKFADVGDLPRADFILPMGDVANNLNE